MVQTISANVNDTISGVAPNDIYLNSEGNLSISLGIDAILENCAEAAKTRLGELIFDVNQGIPYFETVWGGVPNIEQFSGSLRQAFLNVEGVVEVVSLITSQENNTLLYTAIIRTTEGTGGISGNI